MDITPFKDKIKSHLDEVAKKDKLFAKNYKKENKNLDNCCKYIIQQVKEQAKGKNAVGVADEEVYNLAIHYYDEDDIKVGGELPKVKVAHSSDTNAAKKVKKAAAQKAKKTEAPTDDEYVPLSLEIPLFE